MELTVDVLGAQGDGIVRFEKGAGFVPFTLPGETVRVSGKWPKFQLEKILKASDQRVAAKCLHFQTCGGCSVQHLELGKYLNWKRQTLVDAFASEGLTPVVADCIPCPSSSRRRVTFSLERPDNDIEIGFQGPNGFVAIQQCPILLPEISSHLETFKMLGAMLMRGRVGLQLSIAACDNGLDLNFLVEKEPSEAMISDLVRAVAKTPFIRASINGAIAVEHERPYVTFGQAQVQIPPDNFLQAVTNSEVQIADIVLRHLKGQKKLLDLFCGCGTFTLRLAKQSRVHGVETETDALLALQNAQFTDGLKPVTTEKRDLLDAPLTAKELSQYDGVCLDPPRAGAQAQIHELVKSSISKIAYVSCNPVTLARDSAILVKGGFELKNVSPIDQFQYSPHVEGVALFSKVTSRKQRPLFGRKV